MSESIKSRLERIEQALQTLPGEDVAAQWRELRELFTAAAPGNAEMIGTLAIECGTHRLPTLPPIDPGRAGRTSAGTGAIL